MRTAEETLFETCNSFLNSGRRNLTIEEFREEISSDREIKETLNSIQEAMKAYAKEALEEAKKAGVIYTGDPIDYAKIDKKFIQRIIDNLK